MAGVRLTIRGTPEAVIESAARTAQGLGFEVLPSSPRSLAIRRGNLLLSIFLGAFVAYCDFLATAESQPDGTTRLSLQRNTPWWTGVIGVSRVKKKARELADTISRNITAEGMALLGNSDY